MSDLFEAIKTGSIEEVKRLITPETIEERRGDSCETPLTLACRKGHLEIVALLLASGSDVNAQNGNFGDTALHVAVEAVHHSAYDDFMRSAGLDLSPEDVDVHCRLESGDVNCSSCFRHSPLHFAPSSGSIDLVKHLIQAGADISVRNKLGQTPLHYAVTDSMVEVVKILLQSGAEVDAKDVTNQTPLFKSCRIINGKILEIVRVLVDAGADVNSLSSCELQRFCHLRVGALSGDKESTFLLSTQSTKDQSTASTTKATPLHMVAYNGREDVVKLLLDSGANPQIRTEPYDLTPLHFAVLRGHKQTVELLLKSVTNPCVNAVNSEGFSALHIGAYLGLEDVIDVLLHYNADANLSSRLTGIDLNVTPLNEENDWLKRRPMSLLSKEIEATPLHIAAYKGHEKVVKLLLENGADPGLRTDPHYLTPLHMAAARGLKTTVDVLLEDANPCVDAVDSEGLTALHLAAYYGYGNVVDALLNHNADVHVVCRRGRTPLYSACIPISGRDRDHIITTLLEQGLEFTREIYDSCRSSGMFFQFNSNVFEEHYIKMITAGLCPPQSDYSHSILPFRVELSRWERYQKMCEQEVSLMRSTKIDDTRLSYFNLLKNSELVSRNETAVQTLKAQDLKKCFNIYGSLLSLSFKKGLLRRHLLEQCYPIFSTIFSPYEPPVEVIDEVCGYLNNDDLESVCSLYASIITKYTNNNVTVNKCLSHSEL